MKLDKLEKRVLEISKELKLSHIGSCLSVLPILMEIYKKKSKEDVVLMDNGHASLAHYIVLESLGGVSAKKLFLKHGVHANRDIDNGLSASNGSLGHNLGIGIGFALSNPNKTVHIIVSDGSMQEGANWEALRLIKLLKIKNIKIYANFNSYTAVTKIDRLELAERARAFCPDINLYFTYNGSKFKGVEGHYKKI